MKQITAISVNDNKRMTRSRYNRSIQDNKKLNQALNEQQFNNIQHNENYKDEDADDR